MTELTHKEAHQQRASLVREGDRALAYHTITDYQNATPTFPKKRKSRAKRKPTAQPVEALDRFMNVPAQAKTKEDLLLRLNAGLHGVVVHV